MFSNDPPASRTHVVVADDHPVVVTGIRKMLESVPDLIVTAAVVSIAQLFKALEEVACDVLICDYSFEVGDEPDGLRLLERIRRLYPQVRIILLTAHDDLAIVQRAMQLGVAGFLSKSSEEFSDLPSLVGRVMGGEKYLDAVTSKVLLQHVMNHNLPAPSLSALQLSDREMEVARLFVKGMSVTEIAQYTHRSIKTISTQKKKAMIKLGAANDVELINVFNQLF